MEKLCTSPKATLASTGSVHTVTPQPSRARDGGNPAKRKTQGSSITLLVAGNVSLAEPDALECDPMKKAEEGSRRPWNPPLRAPPSPVPPAPRLLGSAHTGPRSGAGRGLFHPPADPTPHVGQRAPPELSPEPAPAPSGGGEHRGCGLRSLTPRLWLWL